MTIVENSIYFNFYLRFLHTIILFLLVYAKYHCSKNDIFSSVFQNLAYLIWLTSFENRTCGVGAVRFFGSGFG